MIAAADLARMKRLRDQAERGGTPLPAATLEAIRAAEEAEDRTGADDEDAGKPGEVQRVADDPHAHDCGCAECDANRAAVGVDCGEHVPGTHYRRGVLIRAHGQRFEARRATAAEPGASDDWEAVGPAPTAPPARSSTKAKVAPPVWVKALTGEIRRWTLELLDPLTTRTAVLERKLAELETRSGATATASALADAYAGVHVDGKHYARGQLVTFGGSLWLAMRDNDDTRPGKSEDWRLIVKHGRDSK